MSIMSNRKRVALNDLKKIKNPAKLPIKKKAIVDDTDDEPVMLDGDNALLLAEACKLNKEKKAAEKRIKKIKTLMDLDKAGEYENKAGDKLVLSMADKYSEIDPEKLFNKFVKNKMKKRFWTIIKVQLGPLTKIVPESSIAKMRHALDPTAKWSFK